MDNEVSRRCATHAWTNWDLHLSIVGVPCVFQGSVILILSSKVEPLYWEHLRASGKSQQRRQGSTATQDQQAYVKQHKVQYERRLMLVTVLLSN